jgi:arginyl-tRNA synthetase
MIAVGFNKYGSEEALARDAIKHLYEVYVKINADANEDESVHDAARAYFKRMEDGKVFSRIDYGLDSVPIRRRVRPYKLA